MPPYSTWTAPGGASRRPATDDRPLRVLRAARTQGRPTGGPGSIRLLVVEDDERDAAALRTALAGARGATFRVAHVTRLDDALERLAAEPFDLVLLDLGLPDCQGIESCDRYLDVAPNVPFVVLTGVEDEDLGLEAVQRGAQDYLVKGAAQGEVVGRALRYAVERHGMLADIARAFRDSRANEENFRGVLERSAEGLVVVGSDGIVRYANPSALALLGRDEPGVVGAPWVAPVAADGSPAEGGEAVEATVLRPDGSRASVDVRTAEVRWQGEQASLVSLVDLAGRRRAERIALAQCVQRSFLPECSDVVDGDLEVRAWNELCQDVSGDVYDVVALADGRWALAVGDVTGHGLAAALLMAKGRAFLRAFCASAGTPAHVLTQMNGAMAGTNTEGRFLTLFLAFLDPRDGRMEWASAGHLPALLRRAGDGAVEMLEATGPPLWIAADAAIEAGPPTTLERDDVLLLYSDGATEAAAEDGERYGLERLVLALARETTSRPSRLVPSLRDRLREYTGKRLIHDDLTLLAASRCSSHERGDGPVTSGPRAPDDRPGTR
jgi:PAS domain S-box-containing protein